LRSAGKIAGRIVSYDASRRAFGSGRLAIAASSDPKKMGAVCRHFAGTFKFNCIIYLLHYQ